jgi:hypothetical protein
VLSLPFTDIVPLDWGPGDGNLVRLVGERYLAGRPVSLPSQEVLHDKDVLAQPDDRENGKRRLARQRRAGHRYAQPSPGLRRVYRTVPEMASHSRHRRVLGFYGADIPDSELGTVAILLGDGHTLADRGYA